MLLKMKVCGLDVIGSEPSAKYFRQGSGSPDRFWVDSLRTKSNLLNLSFSFMKTNQLLSYIALF